MPVFVLDPRLLGGRFPSANRARFLLGCLRELREALRERGARPGRPRGPARGRAARARARVRREAVYFASDVSPFAMARDRRGGRGAAEPASRRQPGHLRRRRRARRASRTRSSRRSGRRGSSCRAARSTARRARCAVPSGLAVGRLPAAPRPDGAPSRSAPASAPRASGATAGSRDGLDRYDERHDRARRRHVGALALPALRLHLGRASSRRARSSAAARRSPASSRGATSTPTSCSTTRQRRARAQERCDALEWDDDDELLAAWREGRTGYPVVDAGMRQLARAPAGCTTARG